MQNCSKLPHQDACSVVSLGFPHITSATSPNSRCLSGRPTSHEATQPHWLPRHEGVLPDSWSYSICHRGGHKKTGISWDQMGNIAFQTRKRSLSQNPGRPRGVKELQAAASLAGCFLLFAERWVFSALWVSWQIFTRNVSKLTDIYRELSTVPDIQLTRAYQPRSAQSCLSSYKGLTFTHGAQALPR